MADVSPDAVSAPAPSPMAVVVEDAADDENPVRALGEYLQYTTHALRLHRDDCNEELSRRAAKMKQDLETARRNVADANARLITSKSDLALARKVRDARKDGSMADPTVKLKKTAKVGDETTQNAREYYTANNYNIDMLRSAFPRHARFWFGEKPTKEDVEDAQKRVDELKVQANRELVNLNEAQKELDELEHKHAAENGEAAAVRTTTTTSSKIGRARAIDKQIEKTKQLFEKKRKLEAADALLTAEQRGPESRGRREKAKRSGRRLRKAQGARVAEGDREKYKELQKKQSQHKKEMKKLHDGKEEADAKARNACENVRTQRATFAEWINDREDKPEGWNAAVMSYRYQQFERLRESEKQIRALKKQGAQSGGRPAAAAACDHVSGDDEEEEEEEEEGEEEEEQGEEEEEEGEEEEEQGEERGKRVAKRKRRRRSRTGRGGGRGGGGGGGGRRGRRVDKRTRKRDGGDGGARGQRQEGEGGREGGGEGGRCVCVCACVFVCARARRKKQVFF